MPPTEHERAAATMAEKDPVRCAVLTVSDTRTAATDRGGDTAVRCLEAAGHRLVARDLVPDDAPRLDARLRAWIADASVQAVVCTGGTGMARRDTTIEVVRRLLHVELDGFGELFRMISYESIGAAAMLSRATGGLALGDPSAADETATDGADDHGTILFAVPGSVNAVETAVERLIAPQLAHLVWERRR